MGCHVLLKNVEPTFHVYTEVFLMNVLAVATLFHCLHAGSGMFSFLLQVPGLPNFPAFGMEPPLSMVCFEEFWTVFRFSLGAITAAMVIHNATLKHMLSVIQNARNSAKNSVSGEEDPQKSKEEGEGGRASQNNNSKYRFE